MPEYGWRTWEVHERSTMAIHVWRPCATRPSMPSGPVWHTRPTRGQGWNGVCLLDKNAPLPFPSNDLSSLHFHNLNNIKSEILQNCSWFLISYFDHNSLIRTWNWVIQKPKLLVLKRATNPKHFQSHLTLSVFPAHWFQSEVLWLYVKLLLFQFLLIISLILSNWLLIYVEKYVRSYARVVWLIS